MAENPIRKAIEDWTEDEWCQGILSEEDLLGRSRQCLEGRCGVGYWSYENDRTVEFLLRDVLKEQYGWHQSIWRWNDEEGRTFDEVYAVAEKAAVKWDETH